MVYVARSSLRLGSDRSNEHIMACTNRQFSSDAASKDPSPSRPFTERIISLKFKNVNTKSVSVVDKRTLGTDKIVRSKGGDHNWLRIILPLMVLGSSSRKTTILGYL